MRTFQTIVVGQGLAGTALAWSLLDRDIDFLVLDRQSPDTSSRVAAGLVTPITGKRGVLSWSWDVAWPLADRFYREVEARCDTRFWNVAPSLRWYHSESERDLFLSRWSGPSEVVEPYVAWERDCEAYDTSLGGLVMKTAGRIDAARYLDASRQVFQSQGAYQHAEVDIDEDLVLDDESIRIPRLDIAARSIVLCQGYSRKANRWFSELPLVPAQGDIVTIDVPQLVEPRTMHRGVWMTPERGTGESSSTRYRVGSTYQWDPLDGQPSEAAREKILARLALWLRLPWRVVDHRAAVRPTSFDQKPLIGRSHLDARVWVFNGLGAKGTLLAPWCAEHLASAIVQDQPIDCSLRWDRSR